MDKTQAQRAKLTGVGERDICRRIEKTKTKTDDTKVRRREERRQRVKWNVIKEGQRGRVRRACH